MDSGLNLFVVEDNDDLREATVEALQRLGHVVRSADCAEAMDEQIGTCQTEVVVLDLNLPGEDGLSIARRLRKAHPHLGIIMVTARTQLTDIAAGYHHGADIYLTKPTTFEALGAAIEALTRRIRPDTDSAVGVSLNPISRQLQGPQGQADLSHLESILLASLIQAHNNSLEYWQLLELSGRSLETNSKPALELQMVRLRKKLEQVGAGSITIKAIRGSGYQLCVRVVIRSR